MTSRTVTRRSDGRIIVVGEHHFPREIATSNVKKYFPKRGGLLVPEVGNLISFDLDEDFSTQRRRGRGYERGGAKNIRDLHIGKTK